MACGAGDFLDVFLIIFSFISMLFTMTAKDVHFIYYGLALLIPGIIISFAPSRLLMDYKNKTIRNYFDRGLL